MYDILVRGGTVVSPTGADLLDVAIVGERIAAIHRPGTYSSDAKSVIDATGHLVMPGGVDPHVHYGTPHIPTAIGDIVPETQEFSPAAAFGGTTTIMDFVFHERPPSLREALADKRAEAESGMAVDFSIHATLIGEISFETIDEIGDVIRDGIPTIKTLSIYPKFMSDDGYRWGVMCEVSKHRGLSMVHAEDDAIYKWLTKKYQREGKVHGAYISETRGTLVEEAGIRRALFLAERSGSPLYIVHMGVGRGVDALAEARARGLPFYGETLITYLSFTGDKLWDDENRGLLWHTTPPIKHQEDQDRLWGAIRDDDVQVVASDHSVVRADERYQVGTTIDSLLGGPVSVELRVPLLFQRGVVEKRISVNRFVELIATNPAKIMGLYPRKGVLAVGSDADIMIFDPNRTWTVRQEDLHMSADYCCWEGWELRGKVRSTILRGHLLVEDENYVGPKASGKFLPRILLPEIVRHSPDLRLTFASAEQAVKSGA